MADRFDFSGWATRNNLRCSDGRVIRHNAFIDNHNDVVPLIWQHDHNSPANVIGHALLENRDEGVYAYCSLNDTDRAIEAGKAVRHGDIDSLSIYANHLTQNGPDVVHGIIQEVSLVIKGANPGAYIDNVIQHSDGTEAYGEEGCIYNDEMINTEKAYYLCHSSDGSVFVSENEEDDEEYYDEGDDVNDMYEEDDLEHADAVDDETVADVLEGMTEKQKVVLYFMIGKALEEQNKSKNDTDDEDSEGGNDMKHNVFDSSDSYVGINSTDPYAIMHGEELLAETDAIFEEARIRNASLRDTILQHAATYGIDDIDWLFPDHKNYTTEPDIISRNMEWTTVFLNGVKHTPFTRIKTIFADITADEARAKGYTKGNKKVEEVFKLLKRVVSPTTVYKKQAFDRDDILDITTFDAVAYVRKEMRVMLNEEIARACLIGDGRDPVENAADKINEECIIPIYKDADLFNIKVPVVVSEDDDEEARAKKLIKAIIRARKDYKGSGSPTFFCTPDVLSDLLLVEDGVGRRLYRTMDELATALLVSKIVTVEVMQGVTREDSGTKTLAGIIVNPADYVIGNDKGGEINTFDDFDIDYNKMKYLMETRLSACLVKPYSAMTVEFETAAG